MPRTADHGPRTTRGGATLAEVLISLLVMGIGLVTVATMFPMAVMQTVKATQLTNATILRYNVEALIDGEPRLVHNPNFEVEAQLGQSPNYLDHNSEDVNRNGRLDQTASYNENDGPPPPPAANTGVAPYDNADGVLDRAYVVDPLGYWQMATIDPTLADRFGNDGAATPSPKGSIRRYTGGTRRVDGAGNLDLAASLNAAGAFVTLPDSWIDLLAEDAIPASWNSLSVTLPAGLDLSSVVTGDAVIERIVLFDQTNKTSQTRTITAITGSPNAGHTVSWDDGSTAPPALPPAPTATRPGFNADTVRIQVQDRRYTWLLTVRKTASPGTANAATGLPPALRTAVQDQTFGSGAALANVDIVILFGSRGNVAEELVYDAAFRVDVDNTPFVMFDIPSGAQPFYKKGSFVFDTEFGHWYRVLDILSESSTQVKLKLDRRPTNITPTSPPGLTGGAILMPGIIDVYPIGNK